MTRVLNTFGLVIAFLVVSSFFLPWIKSGAKPGNTVSALTRKLMEDSKWYERYFLLTKDQWNEAIHHPLEGWSGYELVPLLRGNGLKNRVAQWVASSILGENRIHDKAVFLYSIPATAFLTVLFLFVTYRQKWPLFIPLIGCLGLYGFIRWKLDASYFERLTLQLPVGLGLWISLYGLLLLAGILLLRLILPGGSR